MVSAVAVLVGAGVAAVVGVVAVLAPADGAAVPAPAVHRAGNPAVHVAVALVRGRCAVAVVVLSVTELVGQWVDRRVAVVAVVWGRNKTIFGEAGDCGVASAVAVAVRVEVPGAGVQAVLLVGVAVAVVVDAVAGLLGSRVAGGVRVVAVPVGRGPVPLGGLAAEGGVGVGREAVAVDVRVPQPTGAPIQAVVGVVDQGVAVVVHLVADLDGVRVPGGVPVVAVLAGRPAVRVRVLVAHAAVAVGVHRVATVLLGCAGEGLRRAVVTVLVVVGGALLAKAALQGLGRPVAVPVGVDVEADGRAGGVHRLRRVQGVVLACQQQQKRGHLRMVAPR